MSSINLKSQFLQNIYTGANNANGVNTALMTAFRNAGGADLAALDSRIAAFENIWIDATAKPGSSPGDYPYDRESLKKEFMDEVFSFLLQQSAYRATIMIGAPIVGAIAYSPVDSNGFLKDSSGGTIAIPIPNTNPQQYSQGAQLPNPRNFSELSDDQKRLFLNDSGKAIYNQYLSFITEVFNEGDKLQNNPTDAATGVTVTANVVTAIMDVIVGGVTFNGVTTIGGQTYLVEKGASMYNAVKSQVTNVAGQPVDFALGFDDTLTSTRYIRCDANGVPLAGATVETKFTQRNMSPLEYLYYFMEARIKVVRAKLAFKEGVVNEIRSDLLQAQAAYADLEKQAGGARDRSEDGKTLNPNTTDETVAMDFWEARASKSGEQLLDATGNDDKHNFSDWQTGRSKVKTYIDNKSTQSQDAMLEYQTLLNRYNSAYEVMSKLQEKMDGLVKSQLRNVA